MEHTTEHQHHKIDVSAMPTPRYFYGPITPTVAEELLAKNVQNRSLKSGYVERFKRIIADGLWMPNNGESIKVDWDGNLRDGQHRLQAIVETGIEITGSILYDINPDAFTTLDTGIRRSNAEIFAMAGEANTAVLAGGMKRLYHYLMGAITNIKTQRGAVTADELLDLLDEHPQMRVAATWSGSRGMRRIGRPSINAFSIYVIMRQGESGELFLHRVETGVGLNEQDPAYVLRERLQGIKANKVEIPDYEIAALFFKAFKAHREGKKLRTLTWNRAKEEFPTLELPGA